MLTLFSPLLIDLSIFAIFYLSIYLSIFLFSEVTTGVFFSELNYVYYQGRGRVHLLLPNPLMRVFSSICKRKMMYIIHDTSYIIHHTSYIIHHTSYIIHQIVLSIYGHDRSN